MLCSSLSDYAQNVICAEDMDKVLAFLSRDDIAEVECGRHEIDGERIYANVMEIETAPASSKAYEAHRRYADVHFVIRGEEHFGVAPVAELEPAGEFSEKDDFGLYGEPERESWAILRAGDLVVTPPCDAHKPGCCGEAGPAPLKKICVKVLVA